MTSEEPTTPIGEEPTATTSGERSAAAQPTRALSADLSSEELAILEFERNWTGREEERCHCYTRHDSGALLFGTRTPR